MRKKLGLLRSGICTDPARARFADGRVFVSGCAPHMGVAADARPGSRRRSYDRTGTGGRPHSERTSGQPGAGLARAVPANDVPRRRRVRHRFFRARLDSERPRRRGSGSLSLSARGRHSDIDEDGYPCPPAALRHPDVSSRNSRSLARAVGARRTIVVVVIALASGLVVLLIQRYIGDGHWKWSDALADFVKLFASTIVIVGLLDWYRQRRWQRAEGADLRSLMLMADLVATGWSSPKNIGSPDLDPARVGSGLEQQSDELAKASAELDALYQRLIQEAVLEGFFDLASSGGGLDGYYAEGSRARRLHYLSVVVDAHLPGLIQRRDDPELFGLFVALRDSVVRARAASHHADAVIREQVLLDRPQILVPYLDTQNAASAIDPVPLLARAIEYATTTLMNAPGGLTDKSLDQLAFAKRCVGVIRNEMQWVEDALQVLRRIIRMLEADIRATIDDDAPSLPPGPD